jgi:hypothetical protein
MPFQSKVDLAEKVILEFEQLPDTHPRVFIDSWYVNKCIWKTVKARQWDLTGGLKKNHTLRAMDVEGQLFWWVVADGATALQIQPLLAPAFPHRCELLNLQNHCMGS